MTETLKMQLIDLVYMEIISSSQSHTVSLECSIGGIIWLW